MANSEHINDQAITVGNRGSTLLGPVEDCRRLDLKSSQPRGKEGHVKGFFLGGTPCHFQIPLLLAEHTKQGGAAEKGF